MLKIGDFSRLGQVSIDTLRHYDTLGLLKPAEVDPSTGYRYYAYQQLGRLHRILALKDIGLSLEQIAPMLEGDVSAEQLKGMLKLKRVEIAEHIDTEHERLARVEARLKQIEIESSFSAHDVILKDVRPQLVASIRKPFA
jgi:DNA-binding transcriptional MerR regulator